jgi:hypothetical protein
MSDMELIFTALLFGTFTVSIGLIVLVEIGFKLLALYEWIESKFNG